MILTNMTEVDIGWTKFTKSNNLKFDLPQNIMTYGNSPLSLENKAINSIAISLWTKKDLLDLISFHGHSTSVISSLREWPFFPKFLAKISHLSIPKCFVEPLERAVESIGLQLINFYTSQLKRGISLENLGVYLENLCINNDGTINRLKTVKVLLKNDNVKTLEKYYLACINCLEDDIPDLLKLLPDNFLNNCIDDKSSYLIFYWTFHFRDEYEKWDKFITYRMKLADLNPAYLLKWAIMNENHSAVYYIWENMFKGKHEEFITTFITYRMLSLSPYISYYFISQMDDEEFSGLCCWRARNLGKVIRGNPVWQDVRIHIMKCLEKEGVYNCYIIDSIL